MSIHPFVQLVIVIWVAAAIGSLRTKDSEPFSYAALATFLAGVGYVMIRLRG